MWHSDSTRPGQKIHSYHLFNWVQQRNWKTTLPVTFKLMKCRIYLILHTGCSVIATHSLKGFIFFLRLERSYIENLSASLAQIYFPVMDYEYCSCQVLFLYKHCICRIWNSCKYTLICTNEKQGVCKTFLNSVTKA